MGRTSECAAAGDPDGWTSEGVIRRNSGRLPRYQSLRDGLHLISGTPGAAASAKRRPWRAGQVRRPFRRVDRRRCALGHIPRQGWIFDPRRSEHGFPRRGQPGLGVAGADHLRRSGSDLQSGPRVRPLLTSLLGVGHQPPFDCGVDGVRRGRVGPDPIVSNFGMAELGGPSGLAGGGHNRVEVVDGKE